VVIVPDGHPLTRLSAPTLADIAAFPLITYSRDFAGGSAVVDAFAAAGLSPICG
jgi:DNA-binding transcriptional LysR family regulator